MIDSNLWVFGSVAPDFVSQELMLRVIGDLGGAGWLIRHHHCRSTSDSGDRADVNIKLGIKGLS